MGRPTKRKEDQRQAVTVRLGPQVRTYLEQRARETGRSVAAEVEARAAALATADHETIDLVATIASAIDRVQVESRKRWHRDLRTWAAVAAMLCDGPINDHRPDLLEDDESITEARNLVWRAHGAKASLMDDLRALGVHGSVGIDVVEQDEGNLSFNPETRFPSWQAASRLTGADRLAAEGLLAEVERWDNEEKAALERLHELERPYREAIEGGQRVYRSVAEKLAESYRALRDRIGEERAPLIWRETR